MLNTSQDSDVQKTALLTDLILLPGNKGNSTSYFTISQEPLHPTETEAMSSLGLCISKPGV